jgi:hypothetical protein
MAALGDSFLLPKPGQEVSHLWVLVTPPDADGDAVMVNLTTQRPHSDTTVVLQPGDHPFIRHSTVVNYSDARLVNTPQLDAAINAGICRQLDPVTPAVLNQIQAGLPLSPFTPNKIKAEYRRRTEQQ